jgi:protein-S-isoprenylcysteine O-methyltransferase Ste14
MQRSAATIVIAVVSTLLFLGLAVWGEGGFAAFLSRPVFIALAAVTLGLVVAAFFTRGNLSSGEHEDRSNRWVLAAFAIVGLAVGYLPAYADRIGFFTLDGEATRWVGLGLYAAGGVLRLWPVFVLGRRFSGLVAIQKNHELVTGGVYSIIRHPSYLGMLVNILGWALVFRSGLGVLLALAAIVPVVGRIRAEERLLASQFGPDYEAYRRRTARLIPGLY